MNTNWNIVYIFAPRTCQILASDIRRYCTEQCIFIGFTPKYTKTRPANAPPRSRLRPATALRALTLAVVVHQLTHIRDIHTTHNLWSSALEGLIEFHCVRGYRVPESIHIYNIL